MGKTIDTIPEDVYALFDPNVEHTVNDDLIEEFGENVKNIVRERLKGRSESGDTLRFSALGKPDRQLWYQHHGYEGEEMSPQTYFKFLYGDVIEALVLFLIKEAGHTVELEQHEVEVEGVKGHIDAIIDGVVVDVKSASPYGYQKFANNELVDNDPFGYIQQISGYSNVLTPKQGPAFVAFNKVSGEICVSKVSHSISSDHPPEERIKHLRAVLVADNPPPRCYDDIPDGKSGNRKLGTECSYCAFKRSCWPGLRTFIYSGGPRFLTHVAREPDVYEVQK